MNNKKTYFKPEIEIIKLSLSDVVLKTSTEDANPEVGGGAPAPVDDDGNPVT